MAMQADEAVGQEWAPPGPGAWQADDSHTTSTVPPYMQVLFGPAVGAGFRQGFRNYGALLESIEARYVAHRVYTQARPVGAPRRARSGGPPPPIVFKLLFRLHPELRFRARRAAEVFATRRWRQDRARWRAELAPQLRATYRSLQGLDVTALDDPGLRAHLQSVNELFVKGVELHFSLIPPASIPVGDWLAHVQEWTGAGPLEMLALLRGYSAASVEPATLLEELAEAIRETPAARQILRTPPSDAAAALEQLRASSPRVAASLAAYLDEHGLRLVTGFSLTERTLLEMPHLLLSTVAASVNRAASGPSAKDDGQAAARLRDRVPVAHQAEYDQLLEEARDMYGFRDEHVMDVAWPAGLLRRAVLEAGRRLAARGGIDVVEDVWEATPAEALALLGGSGVAPPDGELAARAAERRRAKI